MLSWSSASTSRGHKALVVITGVVLAYAAFLAIRYSNQPPLDSYAFRQSQTALAAYWMKEEGFKLAYETPVAGAPWSIPFEFPLYQGIVAALAKVSGMPLDAAGRLTSFFFLLLCLIPVRSIGRKLKLNDTVFYAFAALTLSSPIYVYWGRAFLIETTALFFAACALKVFVDVMVDGLDTRKAIRFGVWMSLSILQKVTTALPILAVLGVIYAVSEAKKFQSTRKLDMRRLTLAVCACAIVPLVMGVLWTSYSDHVKELNTFGQQLTASELGMWNFGGWQQRISRDFLVGVWWRRTIVGNLGGVLGLFMMILPWVTAAERRERLISLTAIILGVFPTLVFTNLHLQHEYYQTANVVFLIYAIALGIGTVLPRLPSSSAAVASVIVILISNYYALSSDYLRQMKQVFAADNVDYSVGRTLRQELPPGSEFVAFGNTWSSTFAYMAERKSFTAPTWFHDYEALKIDPERFVEAGRLGGIVSCSGEDLKESDFFHLVRARDWKVGLTSGCHIAAPRKTHADLDAAPVDCDGEVERAESERRDGVAVVSISGWVQPATSDGAPEPLHVVLDGENGLRRDFEAFRTLKRKRAIRGARDDFSGFSVVVDGALPPGNYRLHIVRAQNERWEMCRLERVFSVSQ